MHVNEVRLIGNLGEAPEIKPCSNGATLFKMRVATGEEWHSVEYYSDQEKTVALLSERLSKGMLVYVSGSIATDRYTDTHGKPRVWKKIKAHRLFILRESLREASTFEGVPEDFNPDVPPSTGPVTGTPTTTTPARTRVPAGAFTGFDQD